MTESSYEPPKVWTWQSENGGAFASINRPISGPTHDKELPVGKHPLQLYSLATPNGVKVTVMLEELLALGHAGAEYDAYVINIRDGDQFGSGFVGINPNSKIPALVDRSTPEPTRVFESGAILLYLAEKFGALMPSDPAKRAEMLSWLFWQMGSAPYLGGGFGHFYAYAPTKIEYCIDRFAMETKRQLDVLDKRLAENEYITGDEYTIADIAIWPWYGVLTFNTLYNAAEFLDTASYTNLTRWANQIAGREAVKRGRKVNRISGPLEDQLHERHDASDFDLRTQDKLESAEQHDLTSCNDGPRCPGVAGFFLDAVAGPDRGKIECRCDRLAYWDHRTLFLYRQPWSKSGGVSVGQAGMNDTKDDARDSALMARIAGGDTTAMRALYMAHSESVHRFLRSRLRDEFEVADIVHETMLSVWRGAAGFERRSSVRSWILTLARNKAIDHVRKQSRVTLAEPDESIVLDEPDAATVLTASADAERVRACVGKLPERQRAVVHLAFFEDLSYAEIAKIENAPEGTIKTRIHHAKKLLMRCLSSTAKKV